MKEKGFTLIEVLLTISIFSIVWIMFGNLLNTSLAATLPTFLG
jgi:prepilin-type N-terminal cleavage/methylation domain-containing protein